MKLFKLAVITGAVLSVAGCSSSPSNPDTSYKVSMSPAYVDLLLEKAKAEERARLMAELADQNKGDKRFSDIKIRQLESQVQTMQDDRVEKIANEKKMTYATWQAEQEQQRLAEEQARRDKERAAAQLRAEQEQLAAEEARLAQAEEERLAALRAKQLEMEATRVAEQQAEPVQTAGSSSLRLNDPQVDQLAQVEAYQAPVVEAAPVVEPEPVVVPEPVAQAVVPEPVAPPTYRPEPVVTPEPAPTYTPEPVQTPQYATIEQPTYSAPAPTRTTPPRRTYSVIDNSPIPTEPKRVYSVMDNASPKSSYSSVPEVTSSRSYSAVEQARNSRINAPTNYNQTAPQTSYGQQEQVVETAPVEPTTFENIDYAQIKPNDNANDYAAVDEIAPEPSYNNMDQADQQPVSQPVAQAVIEPAEQPVDIAKLNEIRKALNKPLLPNPYEAQTAQVAPASTPEPTPQLASAETRSPSVLDTQIKQCYTYQTIPAYYHGDIKAVINGTAEKRGKMMKLPSLCESSRTPEVVMKLQQALSDAGYLKPSPPNDLEVIDGIWGSNTLNSLIDYQKVYGLAYGKVSIESLEHLGVIPAGRVKDSAAAPAPEPTYQTAPTPAMLSGITGIRDGKVVMEVPRSTGPISTQGISRCFVNQIIPQNYRGTMPEILEQQGNRVGNRQKLPTLCKRSRSIPIIGRLQQLLHEKGYLKPFVPGGDIIIDGIWGSNTLEAVRAYQRAEGLAYGQLSMEMLYHIGVFK